MRLVIVTGMSGAGKSTALNMLEDADYYCVDNLPLPLVKPFAQIAMDGASSEFTKFAVGIDIRSYMKEKEADFDRTLKDLREAGIPYELLFLDASDEVLLMRYKETRRIHPLAGKDGNVDQAIDRERELLAPLKDEAERGEFDPLSEKEMLEELKLFVEHLTCNCSFITHHTVSGRNLSGPHFLQRKAQIVAALEHEIQHGDMDRLAAMRKNKRTL